ncbi:hypothetical protein GCM10009605_50240 [Nocardiopsis composta]
MFWALPPHRSRPAARARRTGARLRPGSPRPVRGRGVRAASRTALPFPRSRPAVRPTPAVRAAAETPGGAPPQPGPTRSGWWPAPSQTIRQAVSRDRRNGRCISGGLREREEEG